MTIEDWNMVKYCVFSRLDIIEEKIDFEHSNLPKQELIREKHRLKNLYDKVGGIINEMS